MCNCYWNETINVTRETLIACMIIGHLGTVIMYLIIKMIGEIIK